MSEVRAWHVSEALTSFRRLTGILHELTEDEVRHCLALETTAQRRSSIINKLSARLAQFHKEKFDAQAQVRDSLARRKEGSRR